VADCRRSCPPGRRTTDRCRTADRRWMAAGSGARTHSGAVWPAAVHSLPTSNVWVRGQSSYTCHQH